METGNVLYFGYGANRDAKMISAITGKPESGLVGRPAILERYSLFVQRLDQVPNTLLPTAPYRATPRQILRDVWGEAFESYVIKPDTEGRVSGTIWELTALERERVRDWELLDFGWYHDVEGRAKLIDGEEITIITEALDDLQEIDREVDGKNYETWLLPPDKFVEIASKARHEFDERLNADPNGVSKKPEQGF